jgi:hypothetical protein
VGAGRNPAALGLLFTWTRGTHIMENDFIKKSFQNKENISSNLPFETKSVTFIPGKLLPEKR